MKMIELRELGSFRNGLNFAKSEARGKGCKILGVGDFGNATFIHASSLEEINENLVSEEDLISDDDIIFVRSNGNKALVGRMLFAQEISEKVCYSGFCIRFRPNKEVIDPFFLFYMLKTPYCKQQYTPSQQTNINNLSQDTLGTVKIPIPNTFEEQKKRSELLKNLDGKIEINTQACQELESMAKTLYDYWFVQFDFPDENGKPYRTGGGKMKYSKPLKSWIPEGWIETVLSDMANITMGQSPSGESYNEAGEGEVFYQGSTDFGNRFPTPRVYATAPSRFAKKGDILMSVRAPVGTLNIAMEDCCIGRGLSALNSKSGSQLHLLCVLTDYKMRFDAMNSNGTTFGSINKDQLSALPVVAPPKDVLNKFETIVGPIEKKIEDCERQNRCLAKLRGWLLPMLMNGQATISDTDNERTLI